MELTAEQRRIVEHAGSCFTAACPGAGKTTVIVYRVCGLMERASDRRAVALLSFTNSAVVELAVRLRSVTCSEMAYPHLVATFDSFIWQFLVRPFPLPDSGVLPRLVPDKSDVMIGWGQRRLPLSYFDRRTGVLDVDVARRRGFDPESDRQLLQSLERAAKTVLRARLAEGILDFDDVRALAVHRLADGEFRDQLAEVILGRFKELIVDELQDCNATDLDIVKWLRDAGLPVKAICDPHQAIYGFRGGVGKEIEAFARGFESSETLPLTGNFRSTANICGAVASLRSGDSAADEALSHSGTTAEPVYVMEYGGNGVPSIIGDEFARIVDEVGLVRDQCPILAATWASAANAAGVGLVSGQALLLRLCDAVKEFQYSPTTSGRLDALTKLHEIVLIIRGSLKGTTYKRYIVEHAIVDGDWRSEIVLLMRRLSIDETTTGRTWHSRAKSALMHYVPEVSPTINQLLPWNVKLDAAFQDLRSTAMMARSIHSVKGTEYPGVCLVLTTRWAKKVLQFLESGSPVEAAEEARKLYVGASRAQRLLVLAVPRARGAQVCRRLTQENVNYVRRSI